MNLFPLPKIGDKFIMTLAGNTHVIFVHEIGYSDRGRWVVSRSSRMTWYWDDELIGRAFPYTKLTCYLQGIEYEENT